MMNQTHLFVALIILLKNKITCSQSLNILYVKQTAQIPDVFTTLKCDRKDRTVQCGNQEPNKQRKSVVHGLILLMTSLRIFIDQSGLHGFKG